MGLALHDSCDALDLTQRYLSPGPSQVSRPRPRAHYNGAYYHADGSIVLNRELAEHKLPLLGLVLVANHQKATRSQRRTRRRPICRPNRQWSIGEAAEGRALAMSSQKLPGGQRRRTPSLEREEAFRDARTTKSLTYPQDARDISELYRVGLLYDDEHLRGSGFGFEAIDRAGPEYTIRPAKRARKTRAPEVSHDDDLQLALDLTLAELGHGESFAQFLCSPDLEESSSDTESTPSTYSARLAPLHFVSEVLHSPPYFSDDTPDMTTDSESESESDSISDADGSACKPHCTMTRGGISEPSSASHQGAKAWMVLGDGS
ncbi:hypothetical protein CGRA01v4_07901 [Colletotrichum graminicola]|uniref:Uncharacterized protein n=1 Tax=Colletotrichum graminicola (strain M1.001 / M2 / FGSC 10212) TaxID=645133 RepID=E3Q7P8_COLGM|nr:uncharacterized protein GLRG_02081 [Colletotrichum graminicola M1.001]EFQ26910.1 hypothetical protein GLRG_02081 [Colletotrichum graminicola M1.001]WDK16618.1 hypothetical protein CGRA01v4_07901 [Colletotrichum graminicola]